MFSVTQRIDYIQKVKELKQPLGGYLNIKEFNKEEYTDGEILSEETNLNDGVIGTVVDYLSRFVLLDKDPMKSFKISLYGANIKQSQLKDDSYDLVKGFVSNIKGLDDSSIINACKAAQYDVWFRAGGYPGWILKDEINQATINNIKIMVNRSIKFCEEYGNMIETGFTFEKYNGSTSKYTGGYSKVVSSGDGDFLTTDGLWDFKVSKKTPGARDTLQILMYWIMGLHSGQPNFKNITRIGIFNPKLNCVWYINTINIKESLIKFVEEKIICY